MKLNEQQKFMLKKLDPLLEQASIAFLDDSEHFSYLVNHVLAKLENMSFTELTYLKDEVNEIVKEDMEC
ncbi:hypothetical protein [Lactobacillus johnsonii]|uniref:hypothetical protein n=1 Tax=Lactobacillus johnsonii TaxID=33959 RepID=UPI0022E44656|nr:hypothetical protein [Lactobacillus johnsonii]